MASGRPDWYSSVAMHGKHNNDYITLAVDNLGNMLAKMTGLFGTTLKTIAVDTNGIMKANLSVQDLPALKVRPRYGTIGYKALSRDHPGMETWTSEINIVGTGYILGGYLRHYAAVSHKTCYVEMIVDGVAYPTLTFAGLNDFLLNSYDKNPIYEIKFDDTNFEYLVGFPYAWTFESTFVVKVYEAVGAGGTRGGFFYSIFK